MKKSMRSSQCEFLWVWVGNLPVARHTSAGMPRKFHLGEGVSGTWQSCPLVLIG